MSSRRTFIKQMASAGLSVGLSHFISLLPDSSYIVEQWNVVEIPLISSKTYKDPFNQIEVTATFLGPGGKKIVRPLFWDGGKTWTVRFAPPLVGKWHMITRCSDSSNKGLHHNVESIQCRPYSGDLAIYKHGFLRVSDNKRYLVYNDGTPFFYLGDTHWLFVHERFDTSNIKGVSSQFKYTVDKRIDQGFTVYQSEPIQPPHLKGSGSHLGKDEEEFYNLRDGLDANDLPGFANLDRKFKYIADKGLVHANAEICWVLEPCKYPRKYSKSYMSKLAKYWVARYGAYPVLWTIAQEIDKNNYGHYNDKTIEKWYTVGKAIGRYDAYQHPISAHMENTKETVASNSWWGDKPYHDWWAMQWQEGNDPYITDSAMDFWNYSPRQPTILYESAYEDFWTDTKGARGAAYKAFQSGIYGYGYGANGIWNDLYSKNPPDYGTGYQMPKRYLNWYKGANLPGASQLIYFKKFYTCLKWWKLVPRFDDSSWAGFFNVNQSLLASDGRKTFVVYFFGKEEETGTLKKLIKNTLYQAFWYNPRSGTYSMIATFKCKDGRWTVPDKPDEKDWLLLVKQES